MLENKKEIQPKECWQGKKWQKNKLIQLKKRSSKKTTQQT